MIAGTKLASSLSGNMRNEVIRRGVNRVEGKVDALAAGIDKLTSMGVANLALSATGIGVTLVGFSIMTSRLSQIEGRVASLTEGTDRIHAAVERIRQDQLSAELLSLRSQVNLSEEAWLMTDHARAAQVWLDVAQAARPHQDRFEDRARELLLNMPPEFALADPMLDGLSLAGGLRVGCLMACNESAAASAAASKNARQIESITGAIGKADLVMAHLPLASTRLRRNGKTRLRLLKAWRNRLQ